MGGGERWARYQMALPAVHSDLIFLCECGGVLRDCEVDYQDHLGFMHKFRPATLTRLGRIWLSGKRLKERLVAIPSLFS